MKNLNRKTQICLVGNGRLATQLEKVLKENSFTHSHIYRSQHNSEDIKEHISWATHIWLAISDSAIDAFYQQYSAANIQATWVHFSGAHNSPNVFSAHPLMTFSKTPMDQTAFDKIHFVLTAPILRKEQFAFSDILPGLTNTHSVLSPDKKAFYHALCVVAGNFPMILWSEVLTQFQNLQLPTEALHTYLDQITSNFKRDGAKALTGPIVRKDTKTINDNLDALNGNTLKPIYEAFLKAKGVNL
tara:strand:- start:99338 stop:100069 length:732 start_codon:yes stop_codon:yes gene_type:complete